MNEFTEISKLALTLTINGKTVNVASNPGRRLSEVLREEFELKGTKSGCDAGDCGSCTVLVDDQPVCSCLTPVAQVNGRSIVSIEGLNGQIMSTLHQSFLQHGAAQCGICTPAMLIAAHALLNKNQKPTKSDVEDALGGVLCRCTGYQKIVSAVMNAHKVSNTSSDFASVNPTSGNAVGARLERLDGVAKVSGRENFGADFRHKGSLLVRAVRSPEPFAAFTFGDLEQWRKENAGIAVILSASDIKGENRFGVIPAFADQPALAEHEARFRGEAVALVVGDERVVAGLDLDDFPIEWHIRKPNMNVKQALDSKTLLHADRAENILCVGKVICGNAKEAISLSQHVAAMTFETGYVEHAYIEPEAGCAWLEDGVLTIQACTQAPIMDRDETAKVLGLKPEEIRIIPAATGGGFGSKLDISVQPLLGLATLTTGKPCHMVYSRAESMTSTTKRHPAQMKARIGVDNNGKITGMEFEGDFNTGAYASWGPTVSGRVPVHASGPYFTPNYHASARAIHTNGPPSGAFRGFGVPQAAIIQELLYDQLAQKSDLDRLEFRILNALTDGDKTVCGQTPGGIGIGECLEALRDPWHQALEDASEFNRGSDIVKKGVGIASCWYGCGNTALPNPSTILLGITRAGNLLIHQGAMDIGQGSNTVITQICADALGIAIECFELIGPDTLLTPDCGKTSASRQTFVTGKAAELAGKSLRAKILRLSNMGDSADISLQKDMLVITDGEKSHVLKLAEMALEKNDYVISAQATFDPPTTPLDENGQGSPYAVYGYGAQLAQVRVDTRLGTVKVTKIIAAHDLGKVINPMLSEGQIEGGIAQGLGMALMEEFIPGRTENLHDYLIPTFGDMPEIESILIEKTDPIGPMGAKGLGEHVLIPTAPAILNAIRHASGAQLTRIPALPHTVLAAIVQARATK